MATTKPMMFLRTAQTEQRIEELEKQMATVLTHLKLQVEDLAVDQPHPDDEEWERAAPPPIKQSKIAQRVAKAKG